MATFLLTWNPNRWHWDGLAQAISEVQAKGSHVTRWSVGQTRRITIGDRLFLVRLGEEPRGIMASGEAQSEPYEALHWDPDRSEEGVTALYVDVEFDNLLDPENVLLDIAELQSDSTLAEMHWESQSSGITIPDEVANRLEETWENLVGVRRSIGFIAGQVYNRRAEIHGKVGGQQQGGIVTPSDHPIVLLFSSSAGEAYGYEDKFQPDGTFWYTGEGQQGDMVMARGNLAICDHAANGKTLHLFEGAGSGQSRYVGEAVYLDHHIEERPDIDENRRKAIVFELSLESPTQSGEAVPITAGAPVARGRLSSRSLDELRDLARQRASSSVSLKERRTIIRVRSQAIRQYVLKRADGVCEACDKPAPFRNKRREPYLEPHHVRRLADGGPDDPRWVAAVCPNCHRRIHSGEDGDLVNRELGTKLGRIELGA